MKKTYNRTHVLDVIKKHGVLPHTICLMDSEYVYIDERSAADFFSSLSQQVIQLLNGWKAEFCDCDKFSRIVQAIGLAAHATQWAAQQAKPAGITLGVFNYMRSNNRGGHSINFLITKAPGAEAFRMRFFEPQTGKEVTLTPEELTRSFATLL